MTILSPDEKDEVLDEYWKDWAWNYIDGAVWEIEEDEE